MPCIACCASGTCLAIACISGVCDIRIASAVRQASSSPHFSASASRLASISSLGPNCSCICCALATDASAAACCSGVMPFELTCDAGPASITHWPLNTRSIAALCHSDLVFSRTDILISTVAVAPAGAGSAASAWPAATGMPRMVNAVARLRRIDSPLRLTACS